MGRRNLERDFRGSDCDPLGPYLKFCTLAARCERPGCEHRRELNIPLLARAFGPDTKLGVIRQKLRCSKCGRRGPKLMPKWFAER